MREKHSEEIEQVVYDSDLLVHYAVLHFVHYDDQNAMVDVLVYVLTSIDHNMVEQILETVVEDVIN